jgi:disulfide bond formation protein DsbB
MIEWLEKWQTQRSSWLLLLLSALSLILTALYFQYGMELRPCIKCIYQRTAVFGILFAAIIPLLHSSKWTRSVAYFTWGMSSFWGFFIAREHVDLLTAANPFYAPCEIVPNFPSWLPLHQWLPSIFAANGDCLENTWQLVGMGMAQWMMAIFAVYSILLILVIGALLFSYLRKN